jgi:O-antigen/teichoic acid export membrane protein
VILLLAPGILFYNVALITGHYFSGTGKYWVNSTGNFAGLVITILLSGIFFSAYSIDIAAIISTVAYIVTTITILYYFLRESKTGFVKLLPVSSDLQWAWKKVKSITYKA